MEIKLNRRGVASKATRELLVRMNDWVKDNPSHQYKFDRRYTTEEELEQAWQEMKEIGAGVEEASIESTSSESYTENNHQNMSNTENTTSSSRVEEVEDFEIPDEFDLSSFDPNAEETVEREYTKVEYDFTETEEVPEPTFGTAAQQAAQMAQEGMDVPNHMNENDGPRIARPDHSQNTGSPTDEHRITNPQLNDADDKTKKVAAEQMVDMILDVYEKAHTWVKPVVKIKDKNIGELEAKGLISKHDVLPVDEEGNGITLRELAKETNDALEDVLTPDPTFNGRVRPAMIREFTKRGWGMTDMQLIAVAFTQDIAMKGAMVMGVKKQFSEITKLFKQVHAERKAENEGKPVESVQADSISKTKDAEEDEILDTTEAFEEITDTEEIY